MEKNWQDCNAPAYTTCGSNAKYAVVQDEGVVGGLGRCAQGPCRPTNPTAANWACRLSCHGMQLLNRTSMHCAGYLFTYWNSRSLEERKARIDRINRQVRSIKERHG